MRPLLVVEPHTDSADLLVELLGSAGFQVRHHPALDQLDGELDTLAPGLLLLCAGPGDQALAADIVRQAKARRIPVILVSSTGQLSWPGADAVFSKPFDLEALLQTIRELFRG